MEQAGPLVVDDEIGGELAFGNGKVGQPAVEFGGVMRLSVMLVSSAGSDSSLAARSAGSDRLVGLARQLEQGLGAEPFDRYRRAIGQHQARAWRTLPAAHLDDLLHHGGRTPSADTAVPASVTHSVIWPASMARVVPGSHSSTPSVAATSRASALAAA